MQPLSILIVDDARSERVLIKQAIADVRRNLRFFEAQDSDTATELFQRHAPQLTFLDVQLPGQSGLEILSEMTRFQPRAFIVMVSHFSTQDVVVKAVRHGASGYVVKPFTIGKFRELFSRFDRQNREALETLTV